MKKIENINLENVFVSQSNYINDKAVGTISEYGEKLFLIDRKEKCAYLLPEKYQKTPILIYHPAGGLDDSGMIMVSELGEIELQYHHDFDDVAGLWGWIDLDGKEVIKPQYIFAMRFFDNRAVVCKGKWEINEKKEYWCDNEQWGIINPKGDEIVPCKYDEINDIENTDQYILCHEGGWKNGNYIIYDILNKKTIVKLDFDFDSGYMFNECFFANDCICFDEHIPGEETDYIYIYSIKDKKWIACKEKMEKRELNGETKIVINKNGEDIIVF